MGMKRTTGWLTALVLLGMAGCEIGFDDPSKVVDLRILGLKTEPPEFVTPDYADKDREVTLSILLADPLKEGKDDGFHCLLRGCVLPSDHRCDGEDTAVVLAEGPCARGETSFPVTVPADLIRATRAADPSWKAIDAGIRQAIAEGVPPAVAELGWNLYSGTAVWIEFVVTGGEHELRGLQSVILSPVNPVGRVANSNPRIAGVRLDGQAGGTVPEIPFTPGESIRVEVLSTWNSKETFILPTFDPPGGIAVLDEYLTFAFFADAGDFSPDSTTDRPRNLFNTDPDAEPEPVDLWSTWTPPPVEEIPPDGINFWFLLIDGRGGTDWMTLKGELKVDEPAS